MIAVSKTGLKLLRFCRFIEEPELRGLPQGVVGLGGRFSGYEKIFLGSELS
jgi:hypothetical protein